MKSVYFDSSVFLAIIGGAPQAENIRLLVSELKRRKVRIITSIITVQEVSVSTFRRGVPALDNYAVINKMARILSIDKDIALTAAKYEAHALDSFPSSNAADKAQENKRRKIDCFHIACAVVNEASTVYSLDKGMIKKGQGFRLPGIAFLEPEPTEPMLDLRASSPHSDYTPPMKAPEEARA